MPPILTDDQQTQILRSMAPLDEMTRIAFRTALQHMLADRTTIGDGWLFRVCADLQRECLRGRYPDTHALAARPCAEGGVLARAGRDARPLLRARRYTTRACQNAHRQSGALRPLDRRAAAA
jgi:hypothetical protein